MTKTRSTKATTFSLRPILALGAGLFAAGLLMNIPAHAATTAVSHSTKKDAGAAARRQTRMSAHKSTTHRKHYTKHYATHHVTHHTMAHSSKKMGHKTAHQNQSLGATTKTQ